MFLLEERTELILCHQMVPIKDFMNGGVFERWGELLCVRLSQVKDTFPELWSYFTAQRLEMRRSERVGEAGGLCRRTPGQAAGVC